MPVYQNKKTKKWEYRTYADDIYGNRKQFEKGGFNTKRDALQAEREFRLLDRATVINITFQELYNYYEAHIKVKLRAQSYRKITSMFKNNILPYFKQYRLNSITTSIYTKWQSEIEKKGYKHRTKSNLHGAVVMILNYGIKFYGLKENVASMTGNFIKKNELTKSSDFWTYEEYSKFIEVVDDIVYKTFFKTLYFTGLRQGEALALNFNDYDGLYLNIYKTISKETDENGNKMVNDPKTPKSIRKVKLNDEIIKSLDELKDYYKQYVGFDDNWYIFGGIKSLSQSTIGRKKEKWCNDAKVKEIKIHDFRHSHASILMSSGAPITVIADRLGHSDINMTLNTYSHLIPRDEDKAINILNNLK